MTAPARAEALRCCRMRALRQWPWQDWCSSRSRVGVSGPTREIAPSRYHTPHGTTSFSRMCRCGIWSDSHPAVAPGIAPFITGATPPSRLCSASRRLGEEDERAAPGGGPGRARPHPATHASTQGGAEGRRLRTCTKAARAYDASYAAGALLTRCSRWGPMQLPIKTARATTAVRMSHVVPVRRHHRLPPRTRTVRVV